MADRAPSEAPTPSDASRRSSGAGSRARQSADHDLAPLAGSGRRIRYEVLPVAGAAGEVERHVPRQFPITVTASPRRRIEPTVGLVEELSRRGYRTVPHLAARSIVDDAALRGVLGRLAAANVDDVFVIAGDNPRPAGEFSDAYSLLTAMHRIWRAGADRPISRIGVAGYPEGHPLVAPEELADALAAKQSMATYVVSQLCFDPGTIEAWIRELRRDGIRLPVYVGVAGVVERARLFGVAGRIGVGPSARFLRRHRHQAMRLLLPGGYRPDRLLRRLAPMLSDPELDVAGLHVYTLGSLAATGRWRRRALGDPPS